MSINMSENLVNYTDDELLTRYIIRKRKDNIRESNQVIAEWQTACKHKHVNIEHKRIDSYGTGAEFYSNMRCLVCDKRWTEAGSK